LPTIVVRPAASGEANSFCSAFETDRHAGLHSTESMCHEETVRTHVRAVLASLPCTASKARLPCTASKARKASRYCLSVPSPIQLKCGRPR
jgi:hypothetical protein